MKAKLNEKYESADPQKKIKVLKSKSRVSLERISMRASVETKQYLTAAATLSGFNNLTSFILATAHKEAQKVMAETQGRLLSKSDMELVISILNNPPDLNATQKMLLLNASKRYENDMDSGPEL